MDRPRDLADRAQVREAERAGLDDHASMPQLPAQILLLLNAPHVATQNGTTYVSGICQSNLDPNVPAARIAPWLIATRAVPTTSAVAPERRSIGQ